MTSGRLGSAFAIALALGPDVARACAVCGAGADEDGSRFAYIATTVFLSALPLGAFGGFLLWLRRLHRQRSNERPQPTSS